MSTTDAPTLFPQHLTLPRELWSADLDAAAAGQMSVLPARRKAGGELFGRGVSVVRGVDGRITGRVLFNRRGRF